MKPIIRALLIGMIACGLLSCQAYNSTSNDDLLYSSADAAEGKARLTLLNRCGSCHSFHRQTADKMVAQNLIAPGDSASSRLILYIRGTALGGEESMPPGQSMPSTEISLLRSWIDGMTTP